MRKPRATSNLLSGQYIDRLVHWRKDETLWRAALNDSSTRFVPVWRNQNLVRTLDGALHALMLRGTDFQIDMEVEELVLLGEFQQVTCFAVSLRGENLPTFAEPIEAHDLRMIAGELPSEQAGLLAYARAM